MILLKRVWDILSENQGAYLVFNALYYGLVLLCMVYAHFDPALHESTMAKYQGAFMSGPLVMETPTDIESLKIVGRTFFIGVVGSSYTEITLPSFVIPFIGIAVGLYRGAMLGIFFSPVDATIARVFLPHLPTLLLEGQAAVLAMLGAYIHGRGLLWPKTIGQTGRWKAYVEGVRQSGTLYLPIMGILFISALYGIIEATILAAF